MHCPHNRGHAVCHRARFFHRPAPAGLGHGAAHRRKRLGLGAGSSVDAVPQRVLSDDDIKLRRPRLFWVNLLLTVLVMVVCVVLIPVLFPF